MDNGTMMIAVPFHQDTVWAAERDGNVVVAMKPIAENLGLKWHSQFMRLKRSPVLAKGILMMRIPSPGGAQEMICLPIEMLPGWLFGVDTKRVKPALRDRLEQYQLECFKVLWQYFKGDVPKPGPSHLEASVEVHQSIEAHLHPHQLRVLAAAKAYGHLGIEEICDHTGLSWQNTMRCLVVLWYLGIVELDDGNGVSAVRFVPPRKRPALPMPKGKGHKRLR